MESVFYLLCLTLYVDLFITTTRGQMEPPGDIVNVPPLIVDEPPKLLVFREGFSQEMNCTAVGEPKPLYKWKKNGYDFDPSDTDGKVAILSSKGALVFDSTSINDEGIYQCFAVNEVGTATSNKTDLRIAVLEPFPLSVPRRHLPSLGGPLTLRCLHPRSFPRSHVYWAIISAAERLEPIVFTERVTMDLEGNLCFANIRPEDQQEGQQYVCIARNAVTRSFQQGEYATIEPQGEVHQISAPSIAWSPPRYQLALRGDTLRAKCVFSGNPTPLVNWTRTNGTISPRARLESYGMELVIEDVHFEDAGTYECQGINDEVLVPVRRSFHLTVRSSPYSTTVPESVNKTEQESAEFSCDGLGDPSPVVFWYLDGVPISEVPADPRRVVEKNKITFHNLTKYDAQVVQCNIANTYGYIWTNAYLNVITETGMPRQTGAGACVRWSFSAGTYIVSMWLFRALLFLAQI